MNARDVLYNIVSFFAPAEQPTEESIRAWALEQARRPPSSVVWGARDRAMAVGRSTVPHVEEPRQFYQQIVSSRQLVRQTSYNLPAVPRYPSFENPQTPIPEAAKPESDVPQLPFPENPQTPIPEAAEPKPAPDLEATLILTAVRVASPSNRPPGPDTDSFERLIQRFRQ